VSFVIVVPPNSHVNEAGWKTGLGHRATPTSIFACAPPLLPWTVPMFHPFQTFQTSQFVDFQPIFAMLSGVTPCGTDCPHPHSSFTPPFFDFSSFFFCLGRFSPEMLCGGCGLIEFASDVKVLSRPAFVFFFPLFPALLLSFLFELRSSFLF